jgi:hypothetical protein
MQIWLIREALGTWIDNRTASHRPQTFKEMDVGAASEFRGLFPTHNPTHKSLRLI